MSEFKKTRDVSTCQKLPPPKSLRGEEDAEVTWDLILKRYPNAAPLLCQMETVIERAEGLLQQLRSPHDHVLERSSSFQIADSEDELMGPCHVEESTEVSMISEQDSRLASDENMTPEVASIATRSLSDKISDDYQEGKSVGVESSEILEAGEEARSFDVDSSSIYDSNSKSLPSRGAGIEVDLGRVRCSESPVSSGLNLTGSQTPLKKLPEEQEVGKSSSLEAWGKVVGENAAPDRRRRSVNVEPGENPPGVVEAEDSVSEHARRLNAVKIGPTQQIKRPNFIGKREELAQRFAGTISTASKIVEDAKSAEENVGIREAVDHLEPVTADGVDVSKYGEIESPERNPNELGDRTVDSSGNVSRDVEEPNETSETIPEAVEKKFNEVQGNGDEAVAGPEIGPRSPVEILDEYSKICGIVVEYKNQSPSCSYNKNVVVKCCFGGFAFEACSQSKKTAKREAAAKLLRCLAGRQIDGENIADLTPFTRKQIEEIIGLGNGGECETAVRKLYKMCMELNAPEPVYTVHQDSSIVGNRYTVKCGALGITTSGYGIRVLVAKRVAADKLLHNYHENLNAGR